MSFLGVYKASYAYIPQTEQELAIDENDILYLLEKSDVDDWWTVKKRVVGSDVDEPVGLVPSNYIEPADVIGSASALYDYDRQTEEELTFKEGEQFQVYDDKDPDWILVSKGSEYGFVPSNYIEIRKGSSLGGAAPIVPGTLMPPPPHPSQIAQPQVTNETVEDATTQPPPQRNDRQNSYGQQSTNSYPDQEEEVPPLPSKGRPVSDQYQSNNNGGAGSSSRRSTYTSEQDYEDEEAPPPTPQRPGSQSHSRRSSSANVATSSSSRPRDELDEELFTWQVSEVDGRKKRKAMLAIGNGSIYFSPDSVNGGTPQQWSIKDLLSYSDEKKHIFMEFKNPFYSLEIHAGSKDVASDIMGVLGELKGSVNAKALKEVKAASNSKGSIGKKTGKIMYDFEAEGADELTVAEGDLVYILNDKKSKDWWLVQDINSGQSGVVPAQFVEPMKEESKSTLSSIGARMKLSRSKSKENLSSNKSPSKKETKKSLATPKPSRVRTWEDRSGTFKVDAEFLGVVDGKVHLHKTNGVKIGVAAPKLSLADLEYVERVTGMSLDSYKTPSSKKSSSSSSDPDRERKERRERERKRREREEREREEKERERDRRERERERREREMDREERERLRLELDEAKRTLEQPPSKPSRPSSGQDSRRQISASSKEQYDWFEFFLEAGVDVNQCQRYTTNFQNEQIDPEIIESIDAGILRTLGLREGDIIRVTRYIDQKFNRKPKEVETATTGGLFSEPSGALKVNRTGSSNQVTGSLPAPSKPESAATSKSDDDAWTVKPAVISEETSKAGGLQTQQFTGSMQDLVNLKPLEPTKTSSSIKSQTYAPVPAKPAQAIEPVKTGTVTAQPTGIPLDPFKTGGGNLLPLATGGAFVYLPVQPTGALQLQQTGLVPLQRTGGLGPQATGLMPLQRTGGLVPLQKTGGAITGVPTGGLPPSTSFGQPMPVQMPTTSFGQQPQPVLGQQTGSYLTGQRTGPMFNTAYSSQPAGGFPQTSFGAQPTGTFSQPLTGFNTQQTGGFAPTTSFTGQPTGGFSQVTGFNSQPSLFNPQQQQAQMTGFNPSFSQQPTGFNQPSNGFSLSSPPTFNTQHQPQQPFNQQMNGLANTFQNTNISTPQFQQQQPFNTGFQPQQSFNTGFQPQTSFGGFGGQSQPQQQMPSFGGFGQQSQPLQPLEAQPTGFGFGNSGGSSNQRADLSKASAENPFGL